MPDKNEAVTNLYCADGCVPRDKENSTIANLVQQLHTSNFELGQSKKEHARSTSEIDSLQTQLAHARREHYRSMSEIVSLQERLAHAKREHARSRQQATQKLRRSHGKELELQEELDKAKTELDQLKKVLQEVLKQCYKQKKCYTCAKNGNKIQRYVTQRGHPPTLIDRNSVHPIALTEREEQTFVTFCTTCRGLLAPGLDDDDLLHQPTLVTEPFDAGLASLQLPFEKQFIRRRTVCAFPNKHQHCVILNKKTKRRKADSFLSLNLPLNLRINLEGLEGAIFTNSSFHHSSRVAWRFLRN